MVRRPKQESHLGFSYSRRHVQNTTWDFESPHTVSNKPRFLKGSKKTGVLIAAHVSQVGRWDTLDWPLSGLSTKSILATISFQMSSRAKLVKGNGFCLSRTYIKPFSGGLWLTSILEWSFVAE